jgi:hypothetical protein
MTDLNAVSFSSASPVERSRAREGGGAGLHLVVRESMSGHGFPDPDMDSLTTRWDMDSLLSYLLPTRFSAVVYQFCDILEEQQYLSISLTKCYRSFLVFLVLCFVPF